MTNIVRLPGLIDMHTHLRDDVSLKWSHKEDFETGTRAAIAGGFTLVMDMPNNPDHAITEKALLSKMEHAEGRVYCDLGFHFGAAIGNYVEYEKAFPHVYGLKIYMNHTTGNMKVEDPIALDEIFKTWGVVSQKFKQSKPILAHAEAETIKLAISLGKKYQVPLHICHVALEEEILIVKKAKEDGVNITCEATCNNLFLCEDNLEELGPYGLMKPHVGKRSDLESLWKNFDVIDCIATDHAPHARSEKDSENPPFGVPGLETALPLMLTEVNKGRLSLERLIDMTSAAQARLFDIQLDNNTYTEVDMDAEWIIDSKNLYTKCGWTPFDGWKMKGKVHEVVLRGITVFKDGKVIGKPLGVIKNR
jgi:carbamoyl-phosphate synthase/aspartate carbamoyltransferase/dihydroorotase